MITKGLGDTQSYYVHAKVDIPVSEVQGRKDRGCATGEIVESYKSQGINCKVIAVAISFV